MPLNALRFKLSPSTVQRFFEQQTALHRQVRLMFQHHPVLTVPYELLSWNVHDEAQRIHAFLGLAPELAYPRMAKQAVVPIREQLMNYAELRSYFEGSEYAGFFDDPTTGPNWLRAPAARKLGFDYPPAG